MKLIKKLKEYYYKRKLEGRLEVLKLLETPKAEMDYVNYCNYVRERGFNTLYLQAHHNYLDWREEMIRKGCSHT